jgi:hypothetical protein
MKSFVKTRNVINLVRPLRKPQYVCFIPTATDLAGKYGKIIGTAPNGHGKLIQVFDEAHRGLLYFTTVQNYRIIENEKDIFLIQLKFGDTASENKRLT